MCTLCRPVAQSSAEVSAEGSYHLFHSIPMLNLDLLGALVSLAPVHYTQVNEHLLYDGH